MTKCIAAAICAALLSGCALGVDSPVTATGERIGTRKGQTTSRMVFGIGFGDASIATAAHKGGIRRVALVDDEYTNVLWLYTSHTTHVTGAFDDSGDAEPAAEAAAEPQDAPPLRSGKRR